MHNPSEAPSLRAVKTPISEDALDLLFREARTHSAWLPEPVPAELLREAYELARFLTDQRQRLTCATHLSDHSAS